MNSTFSEIHSLECGWLQFMLQIWAQLAIYCFDDVVVMSKTKNIWTTYWIANEIHKCNWGHLWIMAEHHFCQERPFLQLFKKHKTQWFCKHCSIILELAWSQFNCLQIWKPKIRLTQKRKTMDSLWNSDEKCTKCFLKFLECSKQRTPVQNTISIWFIVLFSVDVSTGAKMPNCKKHFTFAQLAFAYCTNNLWKSSFVFEIPKQRNSLTFFVILKAQQCTKSNKQMTVHATNWQHNEQHQMEFESNMTSFLIEDCNGTKSQFGKNRQHKCELMQQIHSKNFHKTNPKVHPLHWCTSHFDQCNCLELWKFSLWHHSVD